MERVDRLSGVVMTDLLAYERRCLAELEKKLLSAVGHKEHCAEQRQVVAFEALTGDAAAKRTLDKLTADAARIDLEIQNIDAAIATAKRRVVEAEEAAERARVIAAAGRARELIPAMREAGREAQRHLEEFVAALARFYDIAGDVHRVGFGAPAPDLVRVNITRSLQTILYPYRLNTEPVQGPRDRRSVDELIDGWATNIEGQIARVIGPEAEAA